MDYKRFLEYYKSYKHVPGVEGLKPGELWYIDRGEISDTYHGVPWEFRYKYAEQMAAEDFGCQFKNNRCVRERSCVKEMGEWWQGLGKESPHVSYCCSTCYISVGNIRILPNDEQLLKQIANMFDYKGRRGFWREGQGCILPHRFRSTLCLVDRCDYLKENVAPRKELIQKIYNLTNVKSLWRREQLK